MTAQALAEKHILVVEDEFFLADDLCRDLQSSGAVVIGPVPSVEQALGLIAAIAVDAAVVDVNLGGEMAYPVADALLAQSVPFVFTSGYDEGALDKRYAQVPRCQKPTEFRTIVKALTTVMAG